MYSAAILVHITLFLLKLRVNKKTTKNCLSISRKSNSKTAIIEVKSKDREK